MSKMPAGIVDHSLCCFVVNAYDEITTQTYIVLMDCYIVNELHVNYEDDVCQFPV